ncbi:shikimate dehydrogenase [Clostridium sp.]|jgi:shikimate dehydrogenase|uniref:shikimate dehydrogenase n=1 Tax=Clostridium sp. TaxID=1506 RepID=UPI0025BE78ED|nr:shikimate dehydrogenase [Clostridium sp.]MCI9070377.1 shikimate dehydrogenase [Clostridium sp.]
MEFYGLLGEKLSHSLSPKINKLILEKNNDEGAYKLFEIPKDKLGDFVKAVKLLKIKGFNVTIPYKESVMKYLDYISDEASRIGAVNTVMLKGNKLYGYNTDYFGIEVMIKSKNIITKNKIAVILGSGGACKAVVTYLLDNEIEKIYIVSRSPINIDLNNKNKKISIINYDELRNMKGDLIINTTPVGMYPNINEAIVNNEVMKNFEVAIDLIYNPTKTKFLQIAEEERKVTLGGLLMLVGQAVKSQSIFNDREINKELIRYVYDDIVKYFN